MYLNSNKISNAVADEKIYKQQQSYTNPKEYFELVLSEMKQQFSSIDSILDIGCADGAFLYHAKKVFSNSRLYAIEPNIALAEIAKNRLSDVNLFKSDLLSPEVDKLVNLANVTTMLGVFTYFQNPEVVIRRLLNLTKIDGSVFVFGAFNEENVDLIMKYRNIDFGNEWIEAHNLFSKKTIEGICSKLDVSYRWVDFNLKNPIPKTDDPMRSWTEPFRGDRNHIIYGTNMFVTMKLLVLKKLSSQSY